MTRAVVDASVLVSALIARRDTPPSQVLRAWARERFELVVSPQLISEVADVLARPKFERYVTSDQVADFLDVLRNDAVVRPDPAVVERTTRDPRDDYLVALARAAEAVLVSSDHDVLEADIDDVDALSPRFPRPARLTP
jgi:putative PIN family toxin of toxin-antitoxin system